MLHIKETRGGLRNPPGGRPKKPDKKVTVQVVLTPKNAEYLGAMGRKKNNYVNLLLDGERKKENDAKDPG